MQQADSSQAVQVLLATYNGERFLREQVDSLLAQTYQPLTILARDDGSSDGTVAILEDYAARFPQRFVVLAPGAPSGSAKANFLRLIAASSAPYLACADQDDVWLPEKIEHSMQVMRTLEATHSRDKPLLVFTDLTVVNENLEIVAPSMWAYQGIDPEKIHHFERLLFANVVTGCTMLFNQPLARLARSMPARASMHDWWVALLASAFGAAGYLPEQTVLYRQHGGNVLGATERIDAKGVPGWRSHGPRRVRWEQTEAQAEAMLELFGNKLDPAKAKLLAAYKQCEHSPNRFVRVWTFARYGFVMDRLRTNLGIAWYLWDMKFAKQADH